MTTILNLKHLHPVHVEEDEHDYHYHIRAECTVKVIRCRHCHSENFVKHSPYEVVIRYLPSHGKRVGIYLNRQRFICRGCSKTFIADIPELHAKREMTRRLVDWIGKQSIKRPFLHIAEETGVTEGTVRSIFRDYINELEAKIHFETPQWMGIDEIHLIKRPRCVIGNIEHNTLIEMLPNRNKQTVIEYLTNMPNRQKVRYVAMDMWRPYRDACQTVLPQAQIVVDKFHVLRMANISMEAVRKAHRADLEPKVRRQLMHDRYILLKRPGELSDRDRLLLSGWVENFPLLKVAYETKEAFFGLYECSNSDEAARYYEAWKNSIPDEVKPYFQDILTAFKNWEPLILSYFDHRITNAFSESMNNLIRLMNRIGRGYSFEALRAKVLYTDRLHKVKRPRFNKRQASDFMMGRHAAGYTVQPDSGAERTTNYGVDISTLASLLEDDGI